MRSFTLIITMAVAILATPVPQIPVDVVSDAVADGIGGLVGSPNHRNHHAENAAHNAAHTAQCHHRTHEEFKACINECVDLCVDDTAGCNTCIRRCSPKNPCSGHHHDGLPGVLAEASE
ncbi:hypothetical protein M426DRAFT_188763 [Hypoxylon sp. CI-4A]|nr:hypothetical protein M426DRAFT_188763 [Hypoxylon sp. CI-4A]